MQIVPDFLVINPSLKPWRYGLNTSLSLIRITICLLIVLVATPAGLRAQSPNQNPRNLRVIHVGLYDNPPKVFRDSQGKPAGLFIDLLEAMAVDEGWQLDYVDCTWNSCLDKLSSGQIDLMPDMAHTPERARLFDFHTVPVAHSWSSLWSRKSLELADWSDLDGKRIAILSGAVQEDALQRILSGFAISYEEVPVTTMAEGFEAVIRGDADVTIANSFFGGLYGPRYGLRENPVIFNPTSLFFAVPKGRNATILDRIDSHLSQWRSEENSLYYQALKKAMSRFHAPVLPRKWLQVLVISISAIAILLVVSVFLRWQVRRQTLELRRMNQRFEYLQQASPVILFQLALFPDKPPKVLWVSDNITRLFGFSPEQTYEPGWWQGIVHPDDREKAHATMYALPENGHSSIEYRIFDIDGSTCYVREELQFIPATDAQPAEVVGSWSDITASREQEDQLSFLTHYDPLTQLPNRSLLRHHLQEILHQVESRDGELAVLSIDLDHFKKINETFSFELGDKILRMTAGRLRHMLRLEDVLARIGADEFILLLQGDNAEELAISVGQRILQSLRTPMQIDNQELVVTGSIGISLYTTESDNPENLLKNAEIARYAAKRQGRNQLQLFSTQLSVDVRENLVMENALRNAVERQELVLHYQPQISLNSGALMGVEALVRWQRPDVGLVPPGHFIPLAEEVGLINDIGLWVLEEACRQAVAWDQQGIHVPRVAVNLAVQQIEGGDLPHLVADILERTGLAAGRLELEVTESTIMNEPELAAMALSEFRSMGIRLAIDDFGTGYSSLAYLKRLPLNILKIDRSFVMDIGTHNDDDIISRAVINLSNSLGMETVAEGIENQQQLDFLRREGCEIGQGFLFSKPLPAQEIAQFVHQHIKTTP